MGKLMGMSPERDRKAEALMKKQKQEQETKLLEEKSELEKRKLLSRGDRSLLVNTSYRGVPRKTKAGA